VCRNLNQLGVGESAFRFKSLLEGAPIFGELRCWCWRRILCMRDCGLEGGGKKFFVDWRS
jgi:hypothetical protein